MAGEPSQIATLEFGDGVAVTPVNLTNIVLTNGTIQLTATGHGFALGEAHVGTIAGVPLADFTGINDNYLFRVVDANTLEAPAPLVTEVGGFTTGTVARQNTSWVLVNNMTTIQTASAHGEIDATALDTPQGATDAVAGSTNETFDLTLNFRPTEAAHSMANGIMAIWRQRQPRWLRIVSPDIGTPAYARAINALMLNATENLAVNQIISLQLTGRASGAILRNQ